MNFDWQIIGHTQQLGFLRKAIEANFLSHAFIFAGPEGVGKKTVASRFAQILLCENRTACGVCSQCHMLALKSNPDLIELNGQNESIGVPEIRTLREKLSLKPYAGQYKFAIIDQAENLTQEASNALLKVFEEPTAYTIIILITTNPQKLLKTIRSRAQIMNFGLVEELEYQNLIVKDLAETQKSLIKTIARGRPGLVKIIATDADLLVKLEDYKKDWEQMRQSNVLDRLLATQKIFDLETPEIKSFLTYWLNDLHASFQIQPSRVSAINLKSIEKAKRLLDQNVNQKLIFFDLCFNLV